MEVVRYSYNSGSSTPVKRGRVTYDIPAVEIEYELKPKTYVALTKDELRRFNRFLNHQGITVNHLHGNFVRVHIKPEIVYERCDLNPISLAVLDSMCQIALNDGYDDVKNKRKAKDK